MAQFEVTRVDPVSIGKVLGGVYFALGVVVAVPFGLWLLTLPSTGFPLGLVAAMPFLYGGLAAVFGAIVGFVYNLMAGTVGGLRIWMTE